jgi:hypothetical protein
MDHDGEVEYCPSHKGDSSKSEEPSPNAVTDAWVPMNRIVVSMPSPIHVDQISGQEVFFVLKGQLQEGS